MLTKNKNSTIIIIISIVFLMTSILTLVLYFCLNNKNNDSSNSILTIECSNVNINVGEEYKLPINVSNDEAILIFDIENDSIATIEGDIIKGLNPGRTLVKVTASLNESSTSCNFYITVIKETLSYNIIPIENCYFEEDSLYLTNSICQFKIVLYDELNNEIINPFYKVTCSDGLNIQSLPFAYLLTANTNGIITFDFYQLNFSVKILIIYNL